MFDNYSHLLNRYVKPRWKGMLLLLLLILSGTGLQLLSPQIIKRFIDIATQNGATKVLLYLALSYIAITLVNQALSVAATYVSENLAWSATNSLRRDLAEHVLQLDMSFHNTHTPGELIERIDGDVTTLANFFSHLWIKMLSGFLFLLGVLGVLYLQDWRVGVVFTTFSLVAIAILNRVRGIAVPYWTKTHQVSANLFGFLEERLAGTEDIRISGAIGYTLEQLHGLLSKRLQVERKASLIGGLTWTFTITFFTLGNAIALLLGALLFRQGLVTLGTVYLIYAYAQMLRIPIEQITGQIQELQKASAGIKRIQELLSISSKIQSGSVSELAQDALSVEFNNVSFGYDTNQVLHHITFRLEPGKTVGVLGRTGSGKTTLSRLIFRLYDPSSGGILINGIDTKKFAVNSLRQKIAMVSQEVQIFNGTLRDNLSFFDRNINDNMLLAGLKELGLWEWYTTLPMGLDTMLGPGGTGISAGEAQLLAFTRVFLKNPGLIILDEPSARLDAGTEKLVVAAIRRLLANRTGVIIAHRLTTINFVDYILLLENGEVKEQGPRQRLEMDCNSRFYQLMQSGLERELA